MASILNAASNVLNQVTEIELDRKNKPTRVLPQGRMTARLALIWSAVLYVLALAIAWMIELAYIDTVDVRVASLGGGKVAFEVVAWKSGRKVAAGSFEVPFGVG